MKKRLRNPAYTILVASSVTVISISVQKAYGEGEKKQLFFEED